MATKREREVLEFKSLYADERYAKKAWKQLIGVSLESDGKMLPVSYDPKTGQPTFQSQVDEMAYYNVKRRLEKMGIDREPQQVELIVECNVLRSRFNDATLNVILERTAGKVKDEVSVVSNDFEHLSDEELELLAKYRDEHKNTEEE